MSAADQKRLSAEAAALYIERMLSLHAHRNWRLTVAICNPGGLTAHQTVEVEAIQQGFDWTAGQLIVQPVSPLSMLTAEQVADISKSVRAGGSWHAYEREKKSRAELKAAQARIAELEAEQASRRTERATIQADELDARHGFVTKVARGMALEEARQVCEDIADKYGEEEGGRWPELKSDAQSGANACENALRALAVETKEG